MKITKKQIKKIILEELSLVMRESTGGAVRFWNVEEAEEGDENVLPLQFGNDLVTIYSETLSEVLVTYFDLDKETLDLVLKKLPGGDSIHSLFAGDEQAASNIELLRSLSEDFVGYPVGELRVGDGDGNTGVKLQYNGKTFDVLNLEELQKKIEKNDGDLEVNLGYGMPSASAIGGIIADEVSGRGEDADVDDEASGYVSSFDPGVADGESGMDYPTTADIRIMKLLDSINSGAHGIKIVQEYEGDPDYIYYDVLV